MSDEKYMLLALEEAKRAAEKCEVPIGAVIVRDGEVIASAHNGRETTFDATAHAETSAIREACRKLKGWHLTNCTLYVTLEPCPMCAGAIINSRIDRVVFGAYDNREGSFGSLINLASYPYSSRPEIVGGVMEKECKEVLSEFFRKIREKK
ncbi:MAG: tRNA adenosine(34) deaminase TadA [Clostridia bacterium]|nr:tRNA adenosine(34) deaminase TadA [Clostridia bacterium]